MWNQSSLATLRSPLDVRDCSTKQSGDLDLRNERLAREGAMGRAQGSELRLALAAAFAGFEFYDHAIYSVGFILSGHTLKHFAAATACFTVLRYFQTRR